MSNRSNTTFPTRLFLIIGLFSQSRILGQVIAFNPANTFYSKTQGYTQSSPFQITRTPSSLSRGSLTRTNANNYFQRSSSTSSSSRATSRSSTRVYSTKAVEGDALEPVFEDVDGIGELTTSVSTTPVEVKPDFVDILTISSNDTQTQQLMDPAAVVEAVIGTALNDVDSNKYIPTGNLLDVDPTVGTSASTSVPTSESETKTDQLETVQEGDIPDLRKIIKFAIPAVGVWLCSPLLSLIDTSSVGLLSGTIQQAALNPAVAITDYGCLLVAFMYTATTNLIAGARANESTCEEKPQTKKTLINAMQLSAYVGTALGSALIVLGPMLLKAIIGNDSIDPKVFAAALRYVRIRALGMPAAVVIGSAQSACIGMQDIRSPMYILAAAAIVNFLGDIIFVPQASLWIGGAAGAAWATVFSQYAALALFFKWLTSRPKQQPLNLTKAILELTGESDEGKSRRRKFRRALMKLSKGKHSSQGENKKSDTTASNNSSITSRPSILPMKKIKSMFRTKTPVTVSKKETERSFTVRGFLADNKKQIFTPPTMAEAKVFWPYFIPVTATSVGRVSAYISMSHVVSSALGTLCMAANQVILSVFYCLTPIADSLNLTAQSFVPAIAQKKATAARARAIRETSINFIKAGLLFSVGMVGAVGCLPIISKYFTSDPVVIGLVNSVVPTLAAVFATHGIVCGLEGVLLGQKDLNFLGKSYGSFFFLVPYFMLRMKKAALEGASNIGLKNLWSVFLCYNVTRAAMWLIRARMLSDNAKKALNAKE
jgi:Na+-driven multidrug efflux pump